MVITNVSIVLLNKIINNGYVCFSNGIITEIGEGKYNGKDKTINGNKNILMPGFIDIHIHGSSGIDFMDASVKDYKTISSSLFKEGVTGYLATTLTSDTNSLKRVCENVNLAMKENPSLLGIHFEGPYINEKYKGAQNPIYIRKPDIVEFDKLNEISGNNIRYISLAPEIDGSLDFIKHITSNGVTVSAGHSDASMNQIKQAMEYGLTNTTHTHNAMSGHHHRHPGIVSAAFYYDKLFTEFICDGYHVSKEALKLSYKIIGSNRFIIITDALKAKNSNIEKFELFGLPCEKKNGVACLMDGTIAGSLLNMDQGVRNMYEFCKCSLNDLARISSYNAARSLNLHKLGQIKVGNFADFVLLDSGLNVIKTIKNGEVCFSR